MALFDHLVGAGKQRGQHFEAERLGGSQVDDEIEFGRLLYRQISRFGTSQYPINIGDTWPTVLRNEVKRVLNQSAIGGRIEIWVDRRSHSLCEALVRDHARRSGRL